MIQIFARSWWKDNKPHMGRKTIIRYVSSIDEAREICSKFNDNRTAKQEKTGYKYEFTKNY